MKLLFHSLIGVYLIALDPAALQAQDRPSFSIPRDRSDIQYHLQIRASRPSSAVREIAGNQFSGGVGFMAMFGDMPLRLRIRMDGDDFPASPEKQRVWGAGLGVEAVYLFPAVGRLEPAISFGPVFQHWEIGGDIDPGPPEQSFNKVASRLEAGLWFWEWISLSLGVLAGGLKNDHITSSSYVAVTFHF